MKAKNAGILSAILGSICCVGPLVLIALGLGTGAPRSSAGITGSLSSRRLQFWPGLGRENQTIFYSIADTRNVKLLKGRFDQILQSQESS